jgi:hypothetical protein
MRFSWGRCRPWAAPGCRDLRDCEVLERRSCGGKATAGAGIRVAGGSVGNEVGRLLASEKLS